MEKGFLASVAEISLSNTMQLVIFGVVMVILQFIWPAYKKQKLWDKSSSIDIAYSFILAFLTPFFYAIAIGFSDSIIQLSPVLSAIPAAFSAKWPFIVQLFIAVFLIDLVSYWRHRLMHTKWLWPIHAIHHSSIRLDWLSTERFHVFNYFITTIINTLVVQIMFGPELALYGSILRRFYNFFIHANVKRHLVRFYNLSYIRVAF